MTVMSNLAFNLLEGERFFMSNTYYKFSLDVSLLVFRLETNQKNIFFKTLNFLSQLQKFLTSTEREKKCVYF